MTRIAKRILIVDDSPLMLDMARAALEEAGYDVVVATDLAQLEDRQEGAVDLILMDVQMPEAFGDDIAMVLRHVRGMATPIYLFSSLPSRDLAERAREAGIEGYIPKTDGVEAMVGRVRGILAGADDVGADGIGGNR